jgi:uncharacterized protein YqjF (DUF2071 family)/predicted DCC family thiol-disulfide oxidoreductase YuxK
MFPFLIANWQNLIVINFEIDPQILKKYLPRGTELDYYQNKTFVSLVAFNFNRNKFLGIIPTFPRYNFEEINLRFYIKKDHKKAVAFIKEVVPSKIIANIANLIYQEPYVALPTSHKFKSTNDTKEFHYFFDNPEKEIYAKAIGNTKELSTNTIEEFILEHYWGYTAQSDASTIEYQVSHPKWRYYEVTDYKVSEDIKKFYGAEFEEVLSKKPHSIFVAEGSKISVSFPKRFFHPLNPSQPKGWILYDGLCGFCSWWIPFWKKAIQKSGYEATAIQTDWVRKKLNLEESELNNDIRLLLNDDTLINGADAYIYGMKQIWWTSPFGWILGLPFFRQITWKFYKIFNRNRFLVSRICKFKPEI